MRKFGYARVSTEQQSLDRQIIQLKQQNIEDHRIFTDKATGTTKNRRGIDLLKLKIEKGDCIYISSIDRLGRDNTEMGKLIKEFTSMGVHIHFIQENLSTDSIHGELIIDIMLAVAKADRKRILENTHEGRLAAKAKGIRFGRKPKIDREKVLELNRKGYKVKDIMEQLDISKSMIYYILNSK